MKIHAVLRPATSLTEPDVDRVVAVFLTQDEACVVAARLNGKAKTYTYESFYLSSSDPDDYDRYDGP